MVVRDTRPRAVGEAGQLPAFLLRRVDHTDQPLEQCLVARLEKQQAPALRRLGCRIGGESKRQDDAVSDELVTHFGQVRAQHCLDLSPRALELLKLFRIEPGFDSGQFYQVGRQLRRGECPRLVAQAVDGQHDRGIGRDQAQERVTGPIARISRRRRPDHECRGGPDGKERQTAFPEAGPVAPAGKFQLHQAPFSEDTPVRAPDLTGSGPSRNPNACRAVVVKGRTSPATLSPTCCNAAAAAAESGASSSSEGTKPATELESTRASATDSIEPDRGRAVATSMTWRVIRAAGSEAERAKSQVAALASARAESSTSCSARCLFKLTR